MSSLVFPCLRVGVVNVKRKVQSDFITLHLSLLVSVLASFVLPCKPIIRFDYQQYTFLLCAMNFYIEPKKSKNGKDYHHHTRRIEGIGKGGGTRVTADPRSTKKRHGCRQPCGNTRIPEGKRLSHIQGEDVQTHFRRGYPPPGL